MSEAISTVEYRDIQDFPGYRVGDDGSVWSAWTKTGLSVPGRRGGTRPLIGVKWNRLRDRNKTGYKRVTLRKADGVQVGRTVHALVLTEFIGPKPHGMECRHLDGNPENCAIENLRWGTPLENARDRVRHGTQAKGISIASSKLTTDDVAEIRSRYNRLADEIANELGVSSSTIKDILLQRTWNHLEVA